MPWCRDMPGCLQYLPWSFLLPYYRQWRFPGWHARIAPFDAKWRFEPKGFCQRLHAPNVQELLWPPLRVALLDLSRQHLTILRLWLQAALAMDAAEVPCKAKEAWGFVSAPKSWELWPNQNQKRYSIMYIVRNIIQYHVIIKPIHILCIILYLIITVRVIHHVNTYIHINISSVALAALRDAAVTASGCLLILFHVSSLQLVNLENLVNCMLVPEFNPLALGWFILKRAGVTTKSMIAFWVNLPIPTKNAVAMNDPPSKNTTVLSVNGTTYFGSRAAAKGVCSSQPAARAACNTKSATVEAPCLRFTNNHGDAGHKLMLVVIKEPGLGFCHCWKLALCSFQNFPLGSTGSILLNLDRLSGTLMKCKLTTSKIWHDNDPVVIIIFFGGLSHWPRTDPSTPHVFAMLRNGCCRGHTGHVLNLLLGHARSQGSLAKTQMSCWHLQPSYFREIYKMIQDDLALLNMIFNINPTLDTPRTTLPKIIVQNYFGYTLHFSFFNI